MAQSRVSAPGDQGIGTRAADLGVWDKLQLGWLDYEIGRGRARSAPSQLGPHEYNTQEGAGRRRRASATSTSTTVLPAPVEGAQQWCSGQGDGYTA